MSDLESWKREYASRVREALSQRPDELGEFDRLWLSGKFREAYVFVTGLHLSGSQEYDEADENFYWGYMH